MKNTLVLFALCIFLFASCSKNENTLTPNAPQAATSSTSGSGQRLGPVPSAFIQKVLLESFTSAANGKCPAQDHLINESIGKHPDQVIAAAFHKNDLMKTSNTAALYDFTGSRQPLVLPAIMVNRIASHNDMIIEDLSWTQVLDAQFTKVPGCGLAIESNITPGTNKMQMNVHCGFNTNNTGSYNLCVYITENVKQSGTGYDQTNSFNNDPGSTFYHAGNPIVNYTHNNVLRKVITTLEGVRIPYTYQTVGGQMVYSALVTLPSGMQYSEGSIVAFIYNTTTHEVMNVQQAQVGTTKDWN